MKSIYVIAGNRNEYQEYKRKKNDYHNTYYYVANRYSLVGISANPDGVFIGTFYLHPDIEELLGYLLTRMTTPEKIESIRKVYQSLNLKNRTDNPFNNSIG